MSDEFKHRRLEEEAKARVPVEPASEESPAPPAERVNEEKPKDERTLPRT
jgi:hypothetical protein